MLSLNSLCGAKTLSSSPSLENLTTGVGLVWLVALVCTSCADGLVFPCSKVENMFIFCIGGVLSITLSTDTLALELKVSTTNFGDLCMETMFLESPPLGLKNHVLMDEVFLGASFGIGNPYHDSDRTNVL